LSLADDRDTGHLPAWPQIQLVPEMRAILGRVYRCRRRAGQDVRDPDTVLPGRQLDPMLTPGTLRAAEDVNDAAWHCKVGLDDVLGLDQGRLSVRVHLQRRLNVVAAGRAGPDRTWTVEADSVQNCAWSAYTTARRSRSIAAAY
jgi:hypothetical protein